MKIVLVGFMGVGKSTISELLAKKLRFELVELDDEIIKISDYKSILKIFSEKGESSFREFESRALKFALNKQASIVLSTGGGIIEHPSNIDCIKSMLECKIVYLTAEFSTIKQRIGDINSRPLFQDEKQARAIYDRRLRLYKDVADIIVATDELTPDGVLSKILEKI